MRQNRHWGRRLAALALTAALTGSAAPALAAGDYWDVDRLDWYYDRWIDNGAEAWYREATAYALDNSLILPFGRSFEGGEVLNRGQFVAILSRLEGIDRDAVEQTGQFTDVTAADYFAPAVYWASASGVVEGASATTFHPEGTITREQVATLLARYLEEKGIILPDDAGAPARFQDTASISGWAAESVEEMRRCGLMEGDSAGRMNPARPVTRAEGVTLFMRLTKQLQAAGAEVGLDGPATPAALEDITFTVERTEMAVGERQQLTYGFPMGAVVPGPLSFDAYCTSDSSREVVTVSGTGLITAVAPGQAAVVLKMEQGGDSGVHIKTVLLTVSGEEIPERPEPEGPTEEAVYAAITALKADYPEGMRWTNDNFYASQALRSGGYGCEGFALICSDAAFGTLPARTHRSFEAIRVGDMIRIGDYHTVVVLEKKENSVMVTEGNYNSSIHWGREITRSSLEREGFSVRTRYPA